MSLTRLLAAALSACTALALGGGASGAPAWLAPVVLTTSDRVAEASLAVSVVGPRVPRAAWLEVKAELRQDAVLVTEQTAEGDLV